MKGMSSWITIADWMLDLGLDARELMVFALVYGVCAHNDRYYGAREYTAKWARCTADTAGRVLNSLTEKGFLLKQEEMTHGNIRRCYYRINRKRLEEGGGQAGPAAGEAPEAPAAAGAETAPDGSENHTGAGAKIAPATGAKIADNITSITDLKDKDKRQEDSVFVDKGKKAESREDATTLFNKSRKFWNDLGLKPECRDLVIPPSEYDCLRTFQHYSWGEIENAIRNYDWHVKGRCGKGFKPPPPYGSIYGFLKNGVARYFDDGAIDQQFKDQRYGA